MVHSFFLDWTTLSDYFSRVGGNRMKAMALKEFKVHALKVPSEVSKSQETLVIPK